MAGLDARMAADAGLKAEVEALRVSIPTAGRAQPGEDQTPRQLALAALEARGHVDGQMPGGRVCGERRLLAASGDPVRTGRYSGLGMANRGG